MAVSEPVHIVFDDIFLATQTSGISRYWLSILDCWSRSEFTDDGKITVLNRSQKIKHHQFDFIPMAPVGLDQRFTAYDRDLLTKICNTIAGKIFISSYYTFPIETRSLFFSYDLIPEKYGFDERDRSWIDRKLYLSIGQDFIAISESTKKDLIGYYPWISPDDVTVATPGIAHHVFNQKAMENTSSFRNRFSVNSEYVVLPGLRRGTDDYKNGRLLFEMLNQVSDFKFEIICTGGEPLSEWEIGVCKRAGVKLQRLELSDDQLAACFAGAHAVIYPSLYEGFGMPPLEALAVGTPVITTLKSSLPESVGSLSLEISGQNPLELHAQIIRAGDPLWRARVAAEGPVWASRFRWEDTADHILSRAIEAANRPPMKSEEVIQERLTKYNQLAIRLQH